MALREGMNYYEIIKANAFDFPVKKAIICESGACAGFIDFINVYDSFKRFTSDSSIENSDRIAIITDDIINYCLMVFPVMDNAVWVPLDLTLSAEKAMEQFELFGVSYIITDDPENPICLAAVAFGIGLIRYSIEGDFCEKNCSFYLEGIKRVDIPEYKIKPDCVIVRSTSGTTSTPKIVPITYRAFEAAIRHKLEKMGYTSQDVMLVYMKVYRVQSINSIMLMLVSGGTTVFEDGFNHSTFLEIIEKYKITTLTAAPAVLNSLADYLEINKIVCGKNSLNFIRSSGALLTDRVKNLLESALSTEIVISYGMTETRNISSTFNAPYGYRSGSVGVSSGAMVKICNNEILVKGSTVFEGYENPEIDNSEYFTDGWFHTGDIGCIDKDGYIFVTGRIKEMINKGGEKISPYEVENAVRMHPLVKDAVVFPYPGSKGEENAGAVVTLFKERLDLPDLRKFLKGKISSYKMPTILFCVDEIPVNDRGKISRTTLYQELSSDPDTKVSIDNKNSKNQLKMSKEQKVISDIIGSALKKKGIALNDNFLDYGGDSLSGAIVLSELERRFKVKVPVNLLFEKGSVKELDEYIRKQKSIKPRSALLYPVKFTGNKKPLICVHSGTGDAVTYRYVGKYMPEDRPVIALKFIMKETGLKHPLTFEKLARVYCNEIKRLYPEGPYYLCGHCWGGVLAHLIARQLKEEGCEIGMLAMFDTARKKKKSESNEKSVGFIKKVLIIIKNSSLQLKDADFKLKTKLILKKIRSFYKLFGLIQNNKIYAIGVKMRSSFIMKISGKSGALGYASMKYFPEPFNGLVHYFKSSRGRTRDPRNADFWRSMSAEFELIEVNSHHNTMIVGEDARVLSNLLSDIMGKTDA